ncbi:MAG: hypothetical protein NZ519_10980 [Bacteroidia bacterium]|nr:hypothetical protein [Bacteroidia bacterium]
MEHAVRQCEAPKRSAVRNAPTLASARGTPKKQNYFSNLIKFFQFLSKKNTNFKQLKQK